MVDESVVIPSICLYVIRCPSCKGWTWCFTPSGIKLVYHCQDEEGDEDDCGDDDDDDAGATTGYPSMNNSPPTASGENPTITNVPI